MSNSKFLKTGIFRAEVVAINPSKEQVNALLGKEVNWRTDYVGMTKEGERKVNFEIWLKEINSGDFYRHKFMVVDKERESKQNPGTFQFINEQGSTTYGKDKADINSKSGEYYEQFRSKNYRKAYVGEENLANFLRAWVLQGKRPTDEVVLSPDMEKIFKGDFSELQNDIESRKENQLTALATITQEKEGKQYQNVWKELIAGWLYDSAVDPNPTGQSEKWLANIQNKDFGCKDVYTIQPLPSGTSTSKPAPKNYADVSNGGDDLPF